MFYVVNNHLNNFYVLSNKGLEKNPKLINVGPTSILEARVSRIKQQIKSFNNVLAVANLQVYELYSTTTPSTLLFHFSPTSLATRLLQILKWFSQECFGLGLYFF